MGVIPMLSKSPSPPPPLTSSPRPPSAATVFPSSSFLRKQEPMAGKGWDGILDSPLPLFPPAPFPSLPTPCIIPPNTLNIRPVPIRILPPTTSQIQAISLLDNLKQGCVEYRMTNNSPHTPNLFQRHTHIPTALARASFLSLSQAPLIPKFILSLSKDEAMEPAARTAFGSSPLHHTIYPIMLIPAKYIPNTPGEGVNALLQTHSSRKHRPSLAPSRHQTQGGWSMTFNHRSVPQTQTHREEK